MTSFELLHLIVPETFRILRQRFSSTNYGAEIGRDMASKIPKNKQPWHSAHSPPQNGYLNKILKIYYFQANVKIKE